MSEQPEPISEQAKLLNDARQASIKTHVEQLRIIQRLKEASAPDCASAPPCTPPETVGDKLAAIGDLVFDLARFHITSYNKLLDLSAQHTDRVVEDLRRLFRRRRQGAPVVRPVVHISAIGSKPNRDMKFEVENRYTVGIHISFSVSEFQPIRGGKPVSTTAEFASDTPVPDPPGDRYLPAGQRRTFEMTFTPHVPPFTAGEAYRASIYVATDGCVIEELPLHVTVTGKRAEEAGK